MAAAGNIKHLRSGFTTGTAAAAAAKAALIYLFSDSRPAHVQVQLLDDSIWCIAIQDGCKVDATTAWCTVVKDAGDDPDITHGALIGARVGLRQDVDEPLVKIIGGPGVGKVTKPGLEILPGCAAITSGPFKMIKIAVNQVCADHDIQAAVWVEIFVPDGEKLARQTLNRRLGIVGGISILGTTGVVRPLSHEAYIKTISAALSVARAVGLKAVVLTTGRRSERFAQQCWPWLSDEGFIQIGDYFADSLQMAKAQGFTTITLAIFFGKAVKMAQGLAHTHARSARLTLWHLSQWALEVKAEPDFSRRVHQAHTARHAFDFIKIACPALIDRVGTKVVQAARSFAGGDTAVNVVIFDFDGTICSRQGDGPCHPSL